MELILDILVTNSTICFYKAAHGLDDLRSPDSPDPEFALLGLHVQSGPDIPDDLEHLGLFHGTFAKGLADLFQDFLGRMPAPGKIYYEFPHGGHAESGKKRENGNGSAEWVNFDRRYR